MCASQSWPRLHFFGGNYPWENITRIVDIDQKNCSSKVVNQIEARFACLQKCAYNTFHCLGPWLHASLDFISNSDWQ